MPVIEVENLVKAYDGKKVVDDLSFSVDAGEIFGIVGPNGAGKTTTVESVEGLRRPDGGSIRVLGLDPSAIGTRSPSESALNSRRAGYKTRSASARPLTSTHPSTTGRPTRGN